MYTEQEIDAKTTDIVVADDNPEQLDELCEFLRARGFRVEAAGDGEQAVAAISKFHPRVALIDVNMPGWDGIKVAEVSGAINHRLSLLLMSGDPAAVVRANMSHTDAFAVIEKPLAMPHVERFIRAALAT